MFLPNFTEILRILLEFAKFPKPDKLFITQLSSLCIHSPPHQSVEFREVLTSSPDHSDHLAECFRQSPEDEFGQETWVW